MHPYFHPTTILVVDDDPLYVESFKFHFGDEFPCVSYTQPERAIEHILSQEAERPTFDRVVRPAARPAAADEQGAADAALAGAGQIVELSTQANRFRRVSVLVVDYDMPSMNGVQVCRALGHLPVRKLLLTGKAGLDTAIAAFNEGAIDTFLTKHDPDIEKALPRQVRRLQEEYFKSTTEALVTALARRDYPFMLDPAFVEAFGALASSQKIAEYYVRSQPPGVLLVTEAGKPLMQVLQDGDGLRAHWEVARDNGAPPELLELLASRRVLPVFPTPSGYYEAPVRESWSRHLYPAQRIDGEAVWYATLVRPEQAPALFPAGLVTYAAFDAQQHGPRPPSN